MTDIMTKVMETATREELEEVIRNIKDDLATFLSPEDKMTLRYAVLSKTVLKAEQQLRAIEAIEHGSNT